MKLFNYLFLLIFFSSLSLSSFAQCNFGYDMQATANPGEYEFTDLNPNPPSAFSWISIYQYHFSNHISDIDLLPNNSTNTFTFPIDGDYILLYLYYDTSAVYCSDTLVDTVSISGTGNQLGNCSINIIYNINPTSGAVNVIEQSPVIPSTSQFSMSEVSFYTDVNGSLGAYVGSISLQPSSFTGGIMLPGNGDYIGQYYYYDSQASCSDTLLEFISINTNPAMGTCDASFTGYFNPLNYFDHFFTSNSVSHSQYAQFEWDFGDGNVATGFDAYHTYAQDGNYNVCLTVTDTFYNCSNDTCFMLNVPNSIPCLADFFLFQDPNNSSQYYAWNLSINGTDYLWDFGDGNTSTDILPTHIYSNPGSYTVCLTITNTSTGCTDMFCDIINVTLKSGTALNILDPFSTPANINDYQMINNFRIYPNPSDGAFELLIDSKEDFEAEVNIYSITGKKVDTRFIQVSDAQKTFSFNKSNLEAGLYIVSILNTLNGEMTTLKYTKK